MGVPTLKDIAESCGVSTATVSMVLSGKGSISPEVKENIRKTAEALGYVPRKSRRTSSPGFKNVCIIQWEDAPFLWHFSQPFVLELEKLLVEEGLRPIVVHCLPELDSRTLYNEVKSAHAGAVISINYVNPDLFDNLEENGIPVIVLNNNNYQDRYWSVLADDIQGAYDGTQLLIDLGHRNIAFADYRRQNDAVVAERLSGFRLAIQNSRIELPDDYIIKADLKDMAGLTGKLEALMNLKKPPTAVFAHDDYFGAVIYTILKDSGVQIPRDLSMICPGDVLDYSETFYPRLSTMQIDRKLIVRMAWDLLLSRLDSNTGKIRVLKTKLHYTDRGSCSAPESIR